MAMMAFQETDTSGNKNFFCRSNLDAIYMCELLKMCRIFDEGDATITRFTITPKSSPQGKYATDSVFYHWFIFTYVNTNIWASFRENLSSVFPTKRVSKPSPPLQRLARELKFHL